MARKVHVRRIWVSEYDSPMSAYPDMTDEQIIAYERSDDDVNLVAENLVSDDCEVWFTDD